MMEENENTDQFLNNYFAKAKKEHEVVSVNDVENIIATHEDKRMTEHVLNRYKYWLAGGLCLAIAVLFFAKTPSNNSDKTFITSNNKKSGTATVKQNETTQPAAQTELIKPPVKNNTNEIYNTNATASIEKQGSPNIKENDNELKKEDYHFQDDASVNFVSGQKNVNIVFGTTVKRLEIDGVTISESEYSKYASLLEKGKSLRKKSDNLNDRQSTAESMQREKNHRLMKELIKQLQTDQLIDESEHFEFRLTDSKLFIDSVEQNESTFIQYKNLYENLSGMKIAAIKKITIRQ